MISPRMYMILVLFAVGFYHFTITKLIYNQDDNPSTQLTALGFFGSRGGGFLGRLLFWRNDEDETNGILSWLKQPLINFWRNNCTVRWLFLFNCMVYMERLFKFLPWWSTHKNPNLHITDRCYLSWQHHDWGMQYRCECDNKLLNRYSQFNQRQYLFHTVLREALMAPSINPPPSKIWSRRTLTGCLLFLHTFTFFCSEGQIRLVLWRV